LFKFCGNRPYRDNESEQTLLKLGLVSELDVVHARAHMLLTPEVNAIHFPVEPAALEKLPWNLAFKHHVVPLVLDSGVLYAASARPLDRAHVSQLSILADCAVSLVWADTTQIAHRLALETHTQPRQAEAERGNPESFISNGALSDREMHSLLTDALMEIRSVRDQEEASEVVASFSVIQLVNRMIIDAYYQKAS
jgi:hypothetical protein